MDGILILKIEFITLNSPSLAAYFVTDEEFYCL